MVYLDYNATTPLAPEVITAISQCLSDAWGNPSSSYDAGVKAKQIIQTSRQHIANMLGASPTDIIFTSGGTETNNWVLQMGLHIFDSFITDNQKGLGDNADVARDKRRPHFITSNVEHDSVKLVLQHFMDNDTADVTFVPVQHVSGAVSVEDVISAITPNTVMISIMLANNETGVLQPVKEICDNVQSIKRRAGETQRILLHTDAAQALGKIHVDVRSLGVDYLTVVGHKFYGPRIGALYVHSPMHITPAPPILFGGGQERNLRPGTENTPMIAGLGKAAELVYYNLDKYSSHMKNVRDYLEEQLQKNFGDNVCFNGKFTCSSRLPNTCNVSFVKTDLKGGEILFKAPSVQASVGAACHAQDRPSHILLSCGVPEALAWRALRISVGRETSTEDVDNCIQELLAVLS